jgi:hypothetical protein
VAKRQVQFKKFLSQFKSACAIDILKFIKRRYNLEWIELWNSQQKKNLELAFGHGTYLFTFVTKFLFG